MLLAAESCLPRTGHPPCLPFPPRATLPKRPCFLRSFLPYACYKYKENNLKICNKGLPPVSHRRLVPGARTLMIYCRSHAQVGYKWGKEWLAVRNNRLSLLQLMREGKEKMHTLLFSCWSSIWMSVSLALSSSLAACKAAKASGFSPLARLLAPFLDMVRPRGREGSPARRPSSQRSLGASRPCLRPTTFSYLPGRREIT